MKIKKFIRKRVVSTILMSIFIILSLSGILMFLGTSSEKINLLHAYIGIFFILIAIFHIFKNFSSIKNYMEIRSLNIIVLFILALSIFYTIPSENEISSPRKEIMKALFNQPLLKVTQFFKKDINIVKNNFISHGLRVEDEKQSLSQIAKKNNKDIKAMYFIFFEK